MLNLSTEKKGRKEKVTERGDEQLRFRDLRHRGRRIDTKCVMRQWTLMKLTGLKWDHLL